MKKQPTKTLAKAPAKATGHLAAWRACPAFAPTDSLKIEGDNPWQPKTPGSAFYVAVLAKKPATVAKAIELAEKAEIPAGTVQAHLRWFFTWVRDDCALLVNGKRFAAQAAKVKQAA
jgi:hypothetical protein